MATAVPVQREASIVIVGSFNPAIFQPAWLVRQQILGPNDIDETKLEVVHPEVARFPIAWGHMEVVRERFLEDGGTEALIDVLHRHWERLEDEAAGMAQAILREALA